MEQLVPCVLAQVESSCTRNVRCHSPSEPFVYRSDPTLMAAVLINRQRFQLYIVVLLLWELES